MRYNRCNIHHIGSCPDEYIFNSRLSFDPILGRTDPVWPKIDLTPKQPEFYHCDELGCLGHTAGVGRRCLPGASPGLRLGPPGDPMTW
jgi:hypothetical protein